MSSQRYGTTGSKLLLIKAELISEIQQATLQAMEEQGLSPLTVGFFCENAEVYSSLSKAKSSIRVAA